MELLIKTIASFFGLGYAPVASGTFGTIGGVLVFWLEKDSPFIIRIVTFLFIFFIGVWAAHNADEIWGTHDNGKIVIDEVAGYFVSILFFDFSWFLAGFAFIAFRFFDITKIYPASYFDKNIKNGFGVMFDDVVAGLYSLIAVYLFYLSGIHYGWL